jgi:hypothetical protein
MSCKYCNSGGKDEESDEKRGKGNHFPLMNENLDCNNCVIETCPRGRDERPDYSQELPALLDPILQRDPLLIVYNPDGSVGCGSIDPIDMKRVDISRFIYNLDVSNTRRHQIREQMHRIAKMGTMLKDVPEGLQEATELIQGFIDNDAEFDVAARQYLEELKIEHPWLKDV